MKIVGLGADLVNIPRIARLRESHGSRFLDRTFHPNEIQDCLAFSDPNPHLAARFAAKEALAKALGVGVLQLGFSRIRVANEEGGRPVLSVSGTGSELCQAKGVDRLHLSLSHEGDYAFAVVILEGDERR